MTKAARRYKKNCSNTRSFKTKSSRKQTRNTNRKCRKFEKSAKIQNKLQQINLRGFREKLFLRVGDSCGAGSFFKTKEKGGLVQNLKGMHLWLPTDSKKGREPKSTPKTSTKSKNVKESDEQYPFYSQQYKRRRMTRQEQQICLNWFCIFGDQFIQEFSNDQKAKYKPSQWLNKRNQIVSRLKKHLQKIKQIFRSPDKKTSHMGRKAKVQGSDEQLQCTIIDGNIYYFY